MLYRLHKLTKWSAKFTESWKSELPPLPKWTDTFPLVKYWAHEFMPYRAKVMACTKSEREAVIAEAGRLSRRAGISPKPGGKHAPRERAEKHTGK